MAAPRTTLAAVETSIRAVLREVGEGLSAVRRVPWLWARMGADAIGTLATWGVVQALVPLLVRNDLGGSAGTLGAVYAAGGVGAVVAAFATGSRGSPRRPVTVLFLVLAGEGRSGRPVRLRHQRRDGDGRELPDGCALDGRPRGLDDAIHERVEGDLLGRVNSIDWLVSTRLMPIALAVVGPLADALESGRFWWSRDSGARCSCSRSCSCPACSRASGCATALSRPSPLRRARRSSPAAR